MYTVIDTITYRSGWLRHHPEMSQQEGVLAILDPDQVRAPLPQVGRVLISRPDGSSVALGVDEIRSGPPGLVGLFFARVDENQIPRGSVISLARVN
jgi:hypothetical protein